MLNESVRRLASRGAAVALVAIEPVGVGIRDHCAEGPCYPWHRFELANRDLFERWNATMSSYAASHPRLARYVSFIDVVCHNRAVPCDDRIDGVPARPDGSHYEGAGEAEAAVALADRLVPIIGGSTS